MKTKRSGQGWLRRLGHLGGALGMVLAVTGVAMAPASALPGDQVPICHATNANGNPYVEQTVDESAVDGLNGGDHYNGHTGPVWDATLKASKVAWGDIIPPVAPHHLGRNWDAAGQAIYENHCAPLAPVPTGPVTLDKVTTGPNAPVGTTSFTFTVVCESGTVPTSPVQVTADQAALAVATGVAVGDACTITETDAQGAASTSYSVDGGAPAAGGQVVVTAASVTGASVVATNDFPAVPPAQCPVGQVGTPPACVPPPPPPPPPFDECANIVGNQPPGTSCTPPPPADECPDQPGRQTDPDQCGVQVLPQGPITPATPPAPITPAAPEIPGLQGPAVLRPAAGPPTAVGGETVPRTLPQTGSTTLPLVELGLGLILLGIGARLSGRERTALI